MLLGRRCCSKTLLHIRRRNGTRGGSRRRRIHRALTTGGGFRFFSRNWAIRATPDQARQEPSLNHAPARPAACAVTTQPWRQRNDECCCARRPRDKVRRLIGVGACRGRLREQTLRSAGRRQCAARQSAGFRRQCRRPRFLRIRFFGAYVAIDRDAGEAGAVAADLQPIHLHHRRPRRRAGHARVQHRTRRPARADGARLPRVARCPPATHAHDFLRQGTPGRGVQRHFMLVAESSRGNGAQYQLVNEDTRGKGTAGAFGRRLCFEASKLTSTFKRRIVISVREVARRIAAAVRVFDDRGWGRAMTIDRPGAARSRLVTCTATALVLCACGQENRYVAPPPPKVTVAMPVQQKVTRYLEATGYASAINTTNLVARVQGFLQKINYKDGDSVKEGATLFVIEPEPYKLKLEQARAAETGAQATLKQAEAEYERQADLASRQVASKQALDNATANRDSARARLKQAEVDTAQAELNLGYTQVKAPFDGLVTARLVSLGELVGANGPTQLATIVQTAPVCAPHKPALISHGFLRFLANLA